MGSRRKDDLMKGMLCKEVGLFIRMGVIIWQARLEHIKSVHGVTNLFRHQRVVIRLFVIPAKRSPRNIL